MKTIPLFPLNAVLFPDGQLALQVFEVRYLDMIKKCIAGGHEFGVVSLLLGSEVRKPGQAEALARVGTMARVDEWSAPLPALLHVRCVGTARFAIVAAEQLKHGLWMAQTAPLAADLVLPIPPELQNVANALGALIRSLQQSRMVPAQMPVPAPFRLDECGWVANRWCELLALGQEQKQRLLEQENPVLRLELISDVLAENGWLE